MSALSALTLRASEVLANESRPPGAGAGLVEWPSIHVLEGADTGAPVSLHNALL